MVQISTKGKPGSFKRFISSVGATVKNIFTPKDQKATYTLSTPSSPGTATPGSPSSSPSPSSPSSGGSSGGSSIGSRGSSGGSSGNIQQVLTTSGITDSKSGQLKTVNSRQPTQIDLRGLDIKERYSPSSGQFERTRSDLYRQGTKEIIGTRLPTREEQIKIDRREDQLLTTSRNLGRESQEVNRIFAQIDEKERELKKKEEELEKSIRGKVDAEGNFIGTEQEYKEYEKNFKDYEKTVKDFNKDIQKYESLDKDIGVGFFASGGARRDVRDIVSTKRPVVTGFNIFTSTVGGTVENIAFLGGKKDIGKEITYTEPVFGTAEFEPLTGEPIYFKERSQVLQEKDIRSRARLLGDVAGTTAGVGLFLSPAGGYVAAGMGAELGAKYGFKPRRLLNEATTSEKLELALLGGGAAVSGVARGARIALRNVPRARYAGMTKSRYTEFLKKAGRDVSKLDDAEIQWLAVEQKGGRNVELVGYQKSGGLSKEIRIKGELSKTELDKIILSGTGEYATEGIVLFGKGTKTPKPFGFGETGLFEVGSRSATIQRGALGDIKILTQIGEATTKPISSTRFAFQTGISQSKALRQQSRQSVQNLFKGGDIIKDYSKSSVFQFTDDFALSVGKKDTGIILKTKPKGTKFDLDKGGTLDIIQTGDKGSKIFSPKKTSLSKTFQELELKDLNLFKTPPAPKSPTVQLESSRVDTFARPPVSRYAGLGLYEKTETTSTILRPEVKSVYQVDYFKPEVSTGFISSIRTGTTTKSRTRTKTKPVSKLFEEVKIDLAQKSNQQLKPKQLFRQSQALKFIQALKEAQLLKTQQVARVTQVIKSPKVSTGFKPFPFTSKSGEPSKKKEVGIIEVFTRKKGKDISLGKTKTKEEAKELLRGELKETLRASGFATVGGRKTFLDLGEGFTKSKVDPFRVVEKKARRIKRKGKSQEAKEIQLFRKKKWGF